MTALEVKEDGQIWLWDEYPVHNTSYKYDKREPVFVYNQEVATELIRNILRKKETEQGDVPHVKSGIYPIPGLKYEIDIPNHPDCGVKGEKCSMYCHSICEKLDNPESIVPVAVIYVPSYDIFSQSANKAVK